MAKSEKVEVKVSVTVPVGTSRTKVEKTLSTLLKGGSTPEGFKIGSPKVVQEVAATPPQQQQQQPVVSGLLG